MWCMMAQIQAQNDSTSCYAQVSYTYTTNPNGVTTFTAQSSGVPFNSTVVWFDDSSPYPVATGSTWSATVNPGTTVCAMVTGFATFYDSLQQQTYYDSCQATYCETIEEITPPDSSYCNAQASFTYYQDSLHPGQLVFHATYSGLIPAQSFWTVDGQTTGAGTEFTGTVAPGSEVCFTVFGVITSYDSLSNNNYYDTCMAVYCETIGAVNPPDSNGCNAQVTYTYVNNPDGSVTLTAQSSGVPSNSAILWYAGGSPYSVSSGNTWTTTVAPGTTICATVTGFALYYDPMQQVYYYDTCQATFCEEINVPSTGCNAQLSYTYETNPNGVTTFTAQYSGVMTGSVDWTSGGSYAGSGTTYSGVIAPGTEVCAVLYGFNHYYDSLQQITVWDSCYAEYCNVFYDTVPSGGCDATFSYYTDSITGGMVFVGYYGGSNPSYTEWTVNGNTVGTGSVYTGAVTLGDDLCFSVYAITAYYDSLQGTYYDTCYASHCEEVESFMLGTGERETVRIAAYPNPATNSLSLAVSDDALVSSVMIVDAQGRQVLQSESHKQIDISALRNGMYYIKAMDASGRCIWTDQLVKQ